ncbi:MAG: hypothetical protein DRN18_02750 [Thermoplasmata archaeon]|nr:MAG: hypothetical protein DRN18_02750 [Thermoplasmata archaeon]
MADNTHVTREESDKGAHALWREERNLPSGYSSPEEVNMIVEKILELREIKDIKVQMEKCWKEKMECR